MLMPGDIDAPRLAIVLARCARAVGQVGEESVRAAGMCMTDFVALEALLSKGRLSITQIQDKVGLASGSMTAAVDRLEKKGFIRRTPSSTDRRAKLLELTPKGRETVRKVFDHHAAVLEETMQVLNSTEKRRLHALLKKLGLYAAAKILRDDRGTTRLEQQTKGAANVTPAS
ncbi:MAG TPA: MarR family transcriptional regulator [Candidatus Acidoferrales bacterium]|jgi:MarR family 2-MHQ and catechol resistance regulon transcriptional repressor|nr:MarR family transcriptional regulator [Candidatus Acidoferrales bacterium]